MMRQRFADLIFAWDASALPLDPIGPMLPLPLAPETSDLDTRDPDLIIRCSLVPSPLPCPVDPSTIPIVTHGATSCFTTDRGLVIWDGASQLHIVDEGRRIEAQVHLSSIERPFHFSSVAVMMALLLALRYHGLFHLHAAGARFGDGPVMMIPGESGAGKSTLALAMFAAGASWLSDDALLLRDRGTHVEAFGWSRHVRMTDETSQAFPELRPLLTRCPPESARQWQIDPRVAFPERGVVSVAAPFMLLFPRFANGDACSVTELDRADAFGRALHACGWVAANRLVARREQLALLGRLVDGARAVDAAVSGRVLREPGAVVAELRALLG